MDYRAIALVMVLVGSQGVAQPTIPEAKRHCDPAAVR